jgi:Ca2+-binding EF-hand superfamily protein
MMNAGQGARHLSDQIPCKRKIIMSRAAVSVVLFALFLGGAVVAGAACAAPRMDGDADTGETSEALVLPRTAITAAMRPTAVADPDLDGVVSSREATKYYETRFGLLDEDRDGSIKGSEFLRAAVVRSLHGSDGFSQPRPLAFESVDVDGNGMLTPEEFLRADVLRRTFAAAGGIDARRQALFARVDSNQDGGLSREEFIEAGRRDFRNSDADGDGEVTIWEFYAATRL